MTLNYWEKAVSNQYDEDEVDWTREGSGDHFARQMFEEKLSEILFRRDPFAALDIGCGQGWLCKTFLDFNVHAFGIDPSARNIRVAQQNVPYGRFMNCSLGELYATGEWYQQFNLVSALMVFEHLGDAHEGFVQLHSLLQPGGALVVIYGDFNVMTHDRHGTTTVDIQGDVTTGEVALRTDYGERAGVIYDIARRPEVMARAIEGSGLQYHNYQTLTIPEWVARKNPTYNEGDVYFHVLELVRP